MFLKRLELQGFKSFAEKTVLAFDSGVVAIVGPNGSGKSNVADSLRWLLGERDARNLRGGKVEDLIFAGTEKRPRAGLASATLYFDNSSGFFPVEFAEVSVSRRVARDGTSEFSLNKAEVRLKDVVDFFARSRLGARGLSIIGQGDSDMFIKASPHERRLFIEEMLGLKEYQNKKLGAERQLKTSVSNLEKAQALIEELAPRLRLLRRQMKRYEQKEEVARELRDLELSFYGSRVRELRQALENVSPRLRNIDDRLEAAQKKMGDAEKGLEAVKQSEPETNEEHKDIQRKKRELVEKRAVLQREIGKLEARMEFLVREHTAKRSDAPRLLFDIKRIILDLAKEEDITRLREGVARIVRLIEESESGVVPEGERAAWQREMDGVQQALAEIETAIRGFEKQEEEHLRQRENFNREFQEKFGVLERARRELQDLRDERAKIIFEEERTRSRITDLDRQLSEIGRSAADFEGWEGERVEYSEEAVKRMYRLRAELVSIEEIDQSVVSEAKEAEERHLFLTQQVEDLLKAIADLKTLIKDLDHKIRHEFSEALKIINDEFDSFIRLMFGGGKGRLFVEDARPATVSDDGAGTENGAGASDQGGVEVFVRLPRKRISGLEVLSGGERSLVSIAALFALISVSPPPFLVLDEVDAPLDEQNARRFGEILKEFSHKTQFVIITHNRATMEAAETLYGVTMGEDGVSKVLSLKLRESA